MRASLIAILASAALAACTFAASPSGNEAAEQDAAPVTLTASGEAQAAQPLPDGEPLEWAASVVRVDFLEPQDGHADGKLFGMAGGDPAMNGLQTHLAFFRGPADPWRVFSIGDFLDYRIIGQSPGRVDLEISESTMNDNGEIGSQTRHLIVTWTPGANGEAPEAISITPATAS